ncbi:putative oxidoreductase [Pedobacter sp. CG_S7]|uniref:DoxX family protein n=1 Tax=Pedobacter sp. CG_S7 TaxID=3143930 RepID=UPI003399ACDA
MKRVFNTNYNHQSLDFALFLLRIGVACFILTHGLGKLSVVLSGAEIQFGDPIGLGMKFSFYFAIFAEVLCSVFLIIGLATRFALIPLIITMAVAVFVVHPPDGFQKMELPGLYLMVFVFLMFAGPGKFSIDSVISKRTNSRLTF